MRRGMCEVNNQNSAKIKAAWDEYKFFLQASLKNTFNKNPSPFMHDIFNIFTIYFINTQVLL